MKVYKDIFTGNEMFSDTYEMKLVDEVMYEVTGKLVQRKVGDKGILTGEEADEDTDEAIESVIDIALNHGLEECGFENKKAYTTYLEDYTKRLLSKLKETSPDQIEVFETNMNKYMEDLLSRYEDLRFFTGDSSDPCASGMAALCEFRDVDGENRPIMMFFKHGLEEEERSA